MAQFLKIGVLSQSVRRCIVGETVAEVFGEVQSAAFCDFQCIGDSLRIGPEKALPDSGTGRR